MSDEHLVYTVPQVAGLLSVSKSTIYRLLGDGSLEFIRVRTKIRIRRTALERYLDAQQRKHRDGLVRF